MLGIDIERDPSFDARGVQEMDRFDATGHPFTSAKQVKGKSPVRGQVRCRKHPRFVALCPSSRLRRLHCNLGSTVPFEASLGRAQNAETLTTAVGHRLNHALFSLAALLWGRHRRLLLSAG